MKQLPLKEEVDIIPQFSTSAYDAYTVYRSIYSESSKLRRVEVVVEYSTRSGRPVTLKYLTFFTEGGVNDYYYRTI